MQSPVLQRSVSPELKKNHLRATIYFFYLIVLVCKMMGPRALPQKESGDLDCVEYMLC